jgi:methionine-rich copper-binding protein CopC
MKSINFTAKAIFFGCLIFSNALFAQTHLRNSIPADNGVVTAKDPVMQLKFAKKTKLVSVELVDQNQNKILLDLPHTSLMWKEHKVDIPHLSKGRYSAKWLARGRDRIYVSGIIHFEYQD